MVLENQLVGRAHPIDSSGAAQFENVRGGHTNGLPAGRAFFSRATSDVVFEFQPYAGPNALLLDASQPDGSLELATPAAYSRLFVLANSGIGGADGTVRIHNVDGTSGSSRLFVAPDGCDACSVTPTAALHGLAPSDSAASFSCRRPPPGLSIHQTDRGLGNDPDSGEVVSRRDL